MNLVTLISDLEVREGGENFSAGQLQLLCMARTILQRSSIVVLDEATSALDAATEKSLLKAVAVAFEHKTVITIAVSENSSVIHFAKSVLPKCRSAPLNFNRSPRFSVCPDCCKRHVITTFTIYLYNSVGTIGYRSNPQ